jgi:hypothetical protein
MFIALFGSTVLQLSKVLKGSSPNTIQSISLHLMCSRPTKIAKHHQGQTRLSHDFLRSLIGCGTVDGMLV